MPESNEEDGSPEVPGCEGVGGVKVDPHPTYTGPYVARSGDTCCGPGYSQDIVREENEELARRNRVARSTAEGAVAGCFEKTGTIVGHPDERSIDGVTDLAAGMGSEFAEAAIGSRGSIGRACEITDGLSSDGTAYMDPLRERDLAEADAEREGKERTAIKVETLPNITRVGYIDASGNRVEIVVMKVGEHDFFTPNTETEVISVLNGELRLEDGSLGGRVSNGIWFDAGSKYRLIARTPAELRRVFRPVQGAK